LQEQRKAVNETFVKNARSLRAAIKKQRALVSQQKADVDKLRDQIKAQIADQVDALRQEIEGRLEAAAAKRRQLRSEKAEKGDRSLRRLSGNVVKMQKNGRMLDDVLRQRADEVKSVKGIFAAKTLKDFVRCDNFIRRNERRFEVFGPTDPVWALTAATARASEENLTRIERTLDRMCPMRRNSPT
jgi:chromosome segregation ATPase